METKDMQCGECGNEFEGQVEGQEEKNGVNYDTATCPLCGCLAWSVGEGEKY